MSAPRTESKSGARETTDVRKEIHDAPIPESDDEYAKHDDDTPSDADKARDEQAKQEESGQENPT